MRDRLRYALVATVLMTTFVACSGKGKGKEEYEQGLAYIEDGKFSEAAESFEAAIDKNKRDAEYYISYGEALIKLDRFEDAIKAYDKAVSNDATKHTKQGIRGKGIAYYDSKEYESAINSFVKALSMDVANGLNEDINYYLADSYVKTEQYDKAIEVYTSMIEESKKEASLYIKRANVYEKLEKYEDCMKDYDQAISLDKKNYMYYIEKSKVQSAAGKKEDAMNTLAEALKIKAKTEEDRYQMAVVYYHMENRVQAIEVLEKIKDKYAPAYELLGDIYYNASDYEMAAGYYETYLTANKDADNSEAVVKLSNCYINQKEYTKAIAVIEDTLKDKNISEVKRLKYNQIMAYEYSADFDQAYLLAKEYVEAYPKEEDMARELIFLQTRYRS